MIRYIFTFADGSRADFQVDELSSLPPPPRSSEGLPRWMDLDAHRCQHCPMPRGQCTVCPAIEAVYPIIQSFDLRVSSDSCELTVVQNDVTHQAHTSIQNAVRSLIGLQLALSACPTMSRLRPMARFHVPLSDGDQTLFRVFGMHMLRQYLRHAQGESPDWSLASLQALYTDIHDVNRQLADRIRAATHKDATVNGLVILDAFAHEVEYNIETNLKELAPYFAASDAASACMQAVRNPR
jgi:hypothetical protein